MKTKTPNKAVIYARVSSREQEETGYSLPSQVKLLKEYAERKNFKVAKVFSIAESASGSKQRVVFNEMMQYMQKHTVTNLLCEKVDRLTRNFKEAIVANDWVEDDDLRNIHFVKQNLVIHKNAKSDEKFRWDIEIVLAKKYVSNLSEEVKKGQKEKISQGWLPTKPPTGYKTIGEKGHKIHIINREQSPFIQRLFKLYATGNYSIEALTELLHKEGLRNNYGRKVVKSRVHLLLQDPFYFGEFVWNGERYKGKQEPLISKKLFDDVQTKLNKNNGSKPYYSKHLHILRGKIRCGKCKKTVSWENQKGHTYGGCKQCRAQLDKERKYIQQSILEDSLVAKIASIAPKSKRVLDVLEKALKESHSEEIEYFENQKKSLVSQMTRIELRMQTMYDDRLDGRISGEDYDERLKIFELQISGLQDNLKDLQDSNFSYYQAGFAVHELATYADRIYRSENATTEQRRLLLSYSLKNVEVFMGDVNVEYTPTFAFLAEWMPKINSILELEDTADNTAVIKDQVHSFVTEEAKTQLDTKKQFRTEEYRYPERQKGTFVPSHPILLRRQDSNLRPID